MLTDGSKVYKQSGTNNDARSRAGSPSWSDYSLEARVKPLGFPGSNNGTNRHVALMARAKSNTSYYSLALRVNNQLELKKLVSGSSAVLASKPFTVTTGAWYTLRIEVVGTTLRGYVDGTLHLAATDTSLSSGNIGVTTSYGSAEFDDLVVTSLSGVPIPPPPPPPPPPLPPTAPGSLTATAVSPSQTNLSWADNSSDETNFRIVRCTGAGCTDFAQIATLGANVVSYNNTGLTGNTTYTYRVQAYNGAGDSGYSNTAATTTPPPPDPPLNAGAGPIGYASVNALGQNGTTGGAGGPTVTVSTAAEFLDYISRTGPYIIQVFGMITLPGPMHNITSDKTIIVLGATSGFSGGGLNIGLSSSTPSNTMKNKIIRNLVFTNAPDDSINVQQYADHIWIDHCDFSFGNDGLIDIKRGADFITVSWNRFHDHDKTMLLSHDDANAAQDLGRLHVTYHHNSFDGTVQRHPRVRFAEPVHVFNNYYVNNSGYGVASTMNAAVLVEGNYFESVPKPTVIQTGNSDPGRLVQRNNVFVSSGTPQTAGAVAEPSAYYSYTLDNAADVKSIVMAGAGVGAPGF